MTGPGPITGGSMPPDLARLLASATVPDLSAGLIDRIVAEATRPDRVARPVALPRRARARRWTRRGVWSGVIAVNLMLATAVAAAFGGGALTFAKIATVARHVAEHIRAPFHHADPRSVRPRIVHHLTVPAAAIRTVPRVVMPMMAPRVPAAAPVVIRPAVRPSTPMRAPAHLLRPVPNDRGHPLSHAGPYAVHHGGQPPHGRHLRPERASGASLRRGEPVGSHPFRGARPGSGAPMPAPVTPRGDPVPRAEGGAGRESPAEARGLQGDGGMRFDGPRWSSPAAARRDGGIGDRADWPGPGADRAPGWRRRAQEGNPGAGPGWRRRAGLNGAGPGRPGGRIKPLRPGGGGRRPRRF